MEIKAKSKKIADLRAYLEAEKDRLQREIAHSTLTTDEERAGYSNHMAEEATVVFEQARNVGLKRGQELLLAQVEDALKRIDDGSYGICRHCGQAIDLARLRALPMAPLCLSCQEHQEIR
jgi:RNA polymerase-binding protein DksA